MKQVYYQLCCVFVCIGHLLGCASSELLLRDDYEPSRQALQQEEYHLAHSRFPKGETRGFITTTEKLWLAMLAQQEMHESLERLVDQIEQRKTVFISQELNQYFYQKTEDGYFPAEHEVVWFHLLAGLTFLKQNQPEKACVEARRASFYLQDHFDDRITGFDRPQKNFDDAGLRLLSAGLWLSCNEWEHARVDLRVAAQLHPKLQWARSLAEQNVAPKKYIIVGYGSGPEPIWQPEGFTTFQGIYDLRFTADDKNPNIQLMTEDSSFILPMETNLAWYERHQLRNVAIRQELERSSYMIHSSSVKTASFLERGIGNATEVVATVAGVGIATAAIIGGLYLDFATKGASDGQFTALGADLGIEGGKKIYRSGDRANNAIHKHADEYEKEHLDFSKNYRFVRFIPQLWGGFASENTAPLQVLDKQGHPKSPVLQYRSATSEIQLFHFSETPLTQYGYSTP